MTDATIELSNGRRLGYAEYGDPKGRPLVFCHGMPGSRLQGRCFDPAAKDLGFRVIAPDRPGMGLSDLDPARKLTDWPDVVAELADQLGIERFAVVGASGGGPYALACGWKIPTRLNGVAIVSSIGPLDIPGAREGLSRPTAMVTSLTKWAPWTVRLGMALIGKAVSRSSDAPLRQLAKSSPPVDRALLAKPELRAMVTEDGAEAFRSGSRGPAHDIRLCAGDWGFPLSDIEINVDLWHGEEDSTVSMNTARWLAASIPRCRASFVPDAGHLWSLGHMDEVLRQLLDQPRTP